MNAAQKSKTVRTLVRGVRAPEALPERVLDLIIYHELHCHMAGTAAEQGFNLLKRSFVDWNELRVSSPGEIAGLLDGSADALGLAMHFKELLARIHGDRRQTSLEFLTEMNKADARAYLKSLKILDRATIDLVLHQKLAEPVVPVDRQSQRVLERIGLVPLRGSLRQKQKLLQRLVPEDCVLRFHHAVMDLARRMCFEDEAEMNCAGCGLHSSCAYGRARYKRRRKPAGKTRR